ncbi:hypothetical protein GLYMA_05G079302v4 [Glycine max]|nr:hypothetical protein GYH30_011940 [Glycine max]KRH57713.2 hypothetical protein GLYMA_05G079302v4 [Glycine max]
MPIHTFPIRPSSESTNILLLLLLLLDNRNG